MHKKDDFERYLKKQLKNPKFKEEWDKLAEEYDELKKNTHRNAPKSHEVGQGRVKHRPGKTLMNLGILYA